MCSRQRREVPATTRFAAEQGTAYITGNEELKGWDAIYTQMTVADPGSTIYITMNGTTVVPKDILTLAADKQLTLVLDMGNGISWTIDGSSIDTSVVADTDFGVELGTSNVPANLQSTVNSEAMVNARCIWRTTTCLSDGAADRKCRRCGERQ